MEIYRTLIIFVAMHGGYGLVQLAVLYLGSDIAYYGGDTGFWAYTPVSGFVTGNDFTGQQTDNVLDLRAMFGQIINLGDLLYGLLAFNYNVVTDIGSDAGFVYWGVMLIRVVTWLAVIKLTVDVIQFILSSGVLNSTIGLALVVGGAGVTGLLTTLGIVF